MAQKPKLALYWAASCGGCEIAVVRLYAKILDVAEIFDIVLWPCIMDFKYKDVEALPDKSIDLCLFNGAIRNAEQEHMAHLLRQKSKVLVAFGACAYTGGIPGLANVSNREAIFQRVYDETPSTANADGVRPQLSYRVPEGELTLPEFYDSVRTLAQVVPVEYSSRAVRRSKSRSRGCCRPWWKAGCLPPAPWWGPRKRPCAMTAPASRRTNGSGASTGLTRSSQTPHVACWNRASSALAQPREAAVARPAPRSTCLVGAATGRRRTWWTRARSY